MDIKKLSRVLTLAALGIGVGLNTPATADDIDIYLSGTATIADEKPNILIIFDNSGSMDTVVPNSGSQYDPATAYTGNFLPDTIYWSTSGTPKDNDNDRLKSFSSTNNQCNASLTNLATVGFYSGDRIARWEPNRQIWADLISNNDPDYVDCKKDVDNNDAGPAPGNLGFPRNSRGGTSGPYVPSKNQSNVRWRNIRRPTLYTGNYLNWFYSERTGDKTRLEIAKEAVTDIIRGTVNVQFGLMVFNNNSDDTTGPHGGRIVTKIGEGDDHKAAIISTIDGLSATTWTPLSETMWEAYRYFAGKTVDYGDDEPTASPVADSSAYTVDGEGTKTYVSPFSYACQQSYIIYMTDGEPTKDTNATSKIESLPGMGTCTGSSNGKCLDELAGYMHDNDIYNARDGIQRVITYTIGFQTDQQLLRDTATAGGGKYYPAGDAQQLTAAFQTAVSEILSITTSFAAPSVSVNAFNKLFNRDAIYFALFKPDSTVRWDGNIKKFRLGDEGKILDKLGNEAIDPDTSRIKKDACSYWSPTCPDGGEVKKGGVGEVLYKTSPSSRKIFTYTGTQDPSNETLDTADNRIEVGNSKITLEMMGSLPSGDATADAQERQDLINWIRGNDVYDEDFDPGTSVRWSFADPLHSRPLAVTYGGTETSPTIYLFAGTNDGALHMIKDEEGGTDYGTEVWTFYPPELLIHQKELAQNAEGQTPPHIYGMDGTPTAWINDVNGNAVIEPADGDFVYLYIGMRRGGNNYYAFDVTDPASPKLMWRITGGTGGTTGFEKLGQTWSRPVVTTIRHGTGGGNHEAKTVLIFGGGYDVSQDAGWGQDDTDGSGTGTGNAVFIVDPTDGSLIWSVSLTGSNARLEVDHMNFSIPSDIATIDSNGDGETDRLYVGDTGGQLWRIDLGETLSKSQNGGSTAARLANITDGDPATPDDNRKFFYAPDVAQVIDTAYTNPAKGTQPEYDAVTMVSGDRADPKNEAIHDQAYMFRDYNISTPIPLNFATLTTSDLADLTYDLIQQGTSGQQSSAVDELQQKDGWFIDFREPDDTYIGEKGLAPTLILNSVLYFTTFIPTDTSAPDADPCVPSEGTGRLYAVNLYNAAAVFDLNASGGDLTRSDRALNLGGGIPSELVPVFQEDGVRGLVGVGGGAARFDPNVALPRERTFWFQE